MFSKIEDWVQKYVQIQHSFWFSKIVCKSDAEYEQGDKGTGEQELRMASIFGVDGWNLKIVFNILWNNCSWILYVKLNPSELSTGKFIEIDLLKKNIFQLRPWGPVWDWNIDTEHYPLWRPSQFSTVNWFNDGGYIQGTGVATTLVSHL